MLHDVYDVGTWETFTFDSIRIGRSDSIRKWLADTCPLLVVVGDIASFPQYIGVTTHPTD